MSYLECGFEKLSDLNDKRAGEQYHEIDAWSPMEWSAAMAGEIGELAVELGELLAVCNTIKKIQRARPEDVAKIKQLMDNVGDESADIVIYLDLMMKRLNSFADRSYIDGEKLRRLNLHDCVRDKFNKTSDKIGSKVHW